MTQMLRFKVKTTPNRTTVRKMLQVLFLQHFNGFCMERLLFVKKFTLYFRRLNVFLWSIVIVLLLQQVHCQKPPVYESVFLLFFSARSEQTAIQQSHIINPLLTSFARSVRESIAFGFYRTDLAPSSLGLYENLRQYFPVQTSHSVNKSLIS